MPNCEITTTKNKSKAFFTNLCKKKKIKIHVFLSTSVHKQLKSYF